MFLLSIPVLPIHSLELCHVKQKSGSNQNKQLEFTSKCNRDKLILFNCKDFGAFPNNPQWTFSTPNPKHPNSSHSLWFPPIPSLPIRSSYSLPSIPSQSLPSIHPAPPVSVLAASAFSPNTNSLFLFTHHTKVPQKATTKKYYKSRPQKSSFNQRALLFNIITSRMPFVAWLHCSYLLCTVFKFRKLFSISVLNESNMKKMPIA